MKILITGGNGFLGKNLIRELQKRAGTKIHILSRSRSEYPDLQYHQGDVRDIEDVSRTVYRVNPQRVFHLAADLRRVRDARLHRELMGTNVRGTLNMLTVVSETGIEAFVSAGSFEEYGDAPVPFAEDGPLRPASPYGASKAAASLLVATYGKSIIPATVVRFPVVYGEGQVNESFMFKVGKALTTGEVFLMSPGDQTREFLHVDDAVRAMVAAADNIVVCKGEIINICRGEELTLLEVERLIARETGKNGFIEFGATPHRPNEQMRYSGMNRKMRELLGFEPRVSLEEGVRKTFLGALRA
ncbi:MAG: hypothetical protein A3C70_03270 [Candidatus Zambryskibacteria bacterium RIFCSPHIGHO2_02_FULL_43_14]|uniref:Ketoreductase domain-containing protein n=1 Tax=Candidatus Zambryskibacteria bacterium RIFCSPHIGHO2_02_FULL_43_14 TaxID=1802748 RepID=A0A1G2TGE3_9BACT|nr:MAG: hypothetical protein A2829_01075 [Candidatus Zambryskibacteria bacterium RIFCSPHIGHO2_01_FULL_43_60]OHA95701.1 MAG: hypothetical protein A3C70_03270 [Candidatus Zambryskibacteria bacterium RIFCSPHIGHO2_02_FULL_43_14]OHB03859.1 MAG: hypothetical protein A3B03_03640 [Candidatus Zambryskibacteria bacterium RIFCSPLOWO2_01_FULL_42_41]